MYVSQVALVIKNPPANVGDIKKMTPWVWALGWEYPMEEVTAIYSSIVAWRISCTKEPGGLQYIGLQRVGTNWLNLAQFHSSTAHM